MRIQASSRLTDFLLIALLFNLAVTQPLYNLLGEQAEFFVSQSVGRPELIGLVLVFTFILPSAIAALPLIAGCLRRSIALVISHALQLLFWFLIYMPLLIGFGLSGITALVAACLLAVFCVYIYSRLYPARLLMKYLAPAILIFPLFFLFASKASEIMLPRTLDQSRNRATPALDASVVFIVFDEFPLLSLLDGDMNIDRQRFPNFARLAEQSTWYRGATTPSETTQGAVPAALTGLAVEDFSGSLPLHSNFPRNLFTLLAGSHKVSGFETSTLLCPDDICQQYAYMMDDREWFSSFSRDLFTVYSHMVVPRPWSERLPSISNAWGGFAQNGVASINEVKSGAPIDEMTDAIATAKIDKQENWRTRSTQFEAFLDRISSDDQPGLYYLHSLLPHTPWQHLPDGRQYVAARDKVYFGVRADDDPERIYFHQWHDDPYVVNQAWQRHLLQTQYVDSLLGNLLDRLENESLLNDSLVVVMGDHGVSFIPGQSRRSVNGTILSDISAIPLLIKLPGQTTGRTDDSHVRLFDILPTLVDALGIDNDWSFSGQSLLNQRNMENGSTVEIYQSGLKPFSYPFVQHRSHLVQRARDKVQIFGTGSTPKPFNLGPFPELLGADLASLDVRQAASGSFILDSALMYLNIEPEAPFVPRQIWGQWSEMHQSNLGEKPGAMVGQAIAIAINGAIKATTQTYAIPDFANYFSVLLPPSALVAGFNHIQAFTIEVENDKPFLQEIQRLQDHDFSWKMAGQEAALVRSDGRTYSLDQTTMPGQVHIAVEEDTTISYVQSLVLNDGSSERDLVVFREGEFYAVINLNAESVSGENQSPEGTRLLSVPMLYSGEKAAKSTNVRVFLLDGERDLAFELSYPSPCTPQWIYSPPDSWGDVDCANLTASLPPPQDDKFEARLSFREEEILPFTGQNWRVEKSGIGWTVGSHAELNLPIPENGDTWEFRAVVKPFLVPGQLDVQHLRLTVNNRIVKEWELSDSGFGEIAWSLPGDWVDADSGLKLEFELPDASSPYSYGVSDDKRKLGVAFKWIEMKARLTDPQ